MIHERDEIEKKNSELDEEVNEYFKQLESEELKLQELNERAKTLSVEVDEKE